MNVNNLDNTLIFNNFFNDYRNLINLNMDIDVYNSSYLNGKILHALKCIDPNIDNNAPFLNDSPYLTNGYLKEIRRSNKCCNVCSFTQEEEYALIAHEIGHLIAYDKNLGLTDENEELYADQNAVKMGFRNVLKEALLKMKKSNLNPEMNNQLISRISFL